MDDVKGDNRTVEGIRALLDAGGPVYVRKSATWLTPLPMLREVMDVRDKGGRLEVKVRRRDRWVRVDPQDEMFSE